jgi:hypothetical protein
MVAVTTFSWFLRSDVERSAYQRAEESQTSVVLPTTNKPINVCLDFSKLENLQDHYDKWTARCPVCAEEGKDKSGNHLVIYPTGHFGCICHEREDGAEHRKEIFAMVGLKKPQKINQNVQKIIEAQKAIKQETAQKAINAWERAKARWSGTLSDLGPSAEIPEDPKEHFRIFSSLWQKDQTAWVGQRYDCNAAFTSHLFNLATDWERAWDSVQSERLDHTSALVWNSQATARNIKQWAIGRAFLVVEHDEVGRAEQIALLRAMTEGFKLRLLAVLDTGGKSWHGFFDIKSINAMSFQTVSKFLKSIEADAGSFVRGSTRTLGAVRQPDEKNVGGQIQRFVWISQTLKGSK